MSTKIRNYLSQTLLALGIGALTLASSGCGKQEFLVTASTEAQLAPGHFLIPPKVDILLAVDNTGSMTNYYSLLRSKLPGFVQALDSKNWDYHITAIPLASEGPAPYVTASRHDGNYGSLWTPSYPGAQITTADTLNPSYFKPLSEFLNLSLVSYPDNSLNGQEPGFKTIHAALNTKLPQTGFLRNDALLVIVALSSGEDTSGVTICRNADDYMTPFEYRRMAVTACYVDGVQVAIPPSTGGTLQSSFDTYLARFQSLKSSPAQVKFFSAVDLSIPQSSAWHPTRYKEMAANLGGTSYEISNPSQVLTSLAANLQIQRLAIRTKYLFISQAPELSTIKVIKHINGDPGNAVEIPQDAGNGWTYAGWLDNAYAIDAPVLMNQSSGYAIELHGSAKLLGNDTARVTFKLEGSQDTVK